MIEELKDLNQKYMANLSHGDEFAEKVFMYRDCHSDLILTAPHSTCSFVNKKEKVADLYTGALVAYLGIKNNISTIIRSKYTPYKVLISDYIIENNLQEHYFLDIHGFNKDIEADMCLGTADCEPKDCPYLENILEIAAQYHIKTVINHPDYMGKFGLTGRYQKKCQKPNVIQMELHRHLRDFYEEPQIVETVTIPFLTEICKIYKKK